MRNTRTRFPRIWPDFRGDCDAALRAGREELGAAAARAAGRQAETRRMGAEAGDRAGGPGAGLCRPHPPARDRLSQRRPHRRFHHLIGQGRPRDADRRVHHPREGQGPPLADLRRRADALSAAADLDGRRDACRQPARLSRPATAASACRWSSPRSCSTSRRWAARWSSPAATKIRSSAPRRACSRRSMAGVTTCRRCRFRPKASSPGTRTLADRPGVDHHLDQGPAGRGAAQRHRDRPRPRGRRAADRRSRR